MRGSFVSAMLLLARVVTTCSLEQPPNDTDEIIDVLSNSNMAVTESEDQKHD